MSWTAEIAFAEIFSTWFLNACHAYRPQTAFRVESLGGYLTDPDEVGHMTWASASGARIRLRDC